VRGVAVVGALLLLALVANAALAEEARPVGVAATYRAFLLGVAHRDGAAVCHLLAGPAAREFSTRPACARAYARLASLFAPGALKNAMQAGARISVRGDRAQLVPRAPCLGIALLRRFAQGWRFMRPPFAPEPPPGRRWP
jgi:hypothetical protein